MRIDRRCIYIGSTACCETAPRLCFPGRRILCAFRAYELKLGWEVARWRHNYERLPPRHKALLPDEPAKHAAALQCITANQQVIK